MSVSSSRAIGTRFLDGHCHLTDHKLFHRIDEVIAASRAQKIDAFIQGGVHPADWDLQLELFKRYPGVIYPCFGIHPWFVAGRMGVTGESLCKQIDHALSVLENYLSQAVAIGELGIDLGPKTDPATEALQTEIFLKQLQIARSKNLPLVLHIVKAHPQALKLLSENGPWPKGGIVHAFSGSYEIAQEYIRQGFTLSIGGVVARKGYETLKRALKRLPIERMVLESDSPDQIPDGYQGFEEGVNDPRSLWNIAEAVCQIKAAAGSGTQAELTPEKLLEASRRNLSQIFGLELEGASL